MTTPRLAAVLLALTAACGGGAAPTSPPARAGRAAPKPDALLARSFEAWFPELLERQPTFAAGGMGLHAYDGKLPDVSAAGLADQAAWIDRSIARFEAIGPAGLGERSRVVREAILGQLRGERFTLTTMQSPTRNPMWYLGDLGLDAYVSRDYAPLAARARGVIGICNGAAGHLLAARANLPGAMPRPWLETALLMARGHAEFARTDVPAAFAALEDAAVKDQLAAALAAYGAALADYVRFLEAAKQTATDDYALGAEPFVAMLAAKEGLEVDLARLEELGVADLERNLAALAEAAAAMKKKPAAAVKQVAADRPAARDLLALARDQATEARGFLIDKGIVTIPSEDVAEVQETPSFARWNSAFLNVPGMLETRPLPSFYWITLPDPKWSRSEQKAYVPGRKDLLFTTVHELWPGHFLHFLHMKRTPERALQALCSYSMAEGWAHYTEEMMIEEGLGGGDPATRVGMLLNALLRNVRFVSAIGLHAKGMKVEASQQLFETKAFSDKKTARQQAMRGTFDPGYLNYTLGKLVIRKLRDDWKAKQGAAYSLKGFHDRFLSYGCAPLPAIRRAMLGDDSPAL